MPTSNVDEWTALVRSILLAICSGRNTSYTGEIACYFSHERIIAWRNELIRLNPEAYK